MIDWVGDLKHLILPDVARSTIMDLGIKEAWYTWGEGKLCRHYRERDEPPYRFVTGFEHMSPEQLRYRFWLCCHAAAREHQGGRRHYASPFTFMGKLQELRCSSVIDALAMSAETLRELFIEPSRKDDKPQRWRHIHEEFEKRHVYLLDDNGPLGEVYAFGHKENVGRIFYSVWDGKMGVAVRVGGVAKVTVTADGKPFDWNKWCEEDDDGDDD